MNILCRLISVVALNIFLITSVTAQSIGLIFKSENNDSPNQVLLFGSSHDGFAILEGVKKRVQMHLDTSCEAFVDEATPDLSESFETISNLSLIASTGNVLNEETIEKVFLILKRKFSVTLAVFNAETISKIKLLPISTLTLLLQSSVNVVDMPKNQGNSIDQIFKDVAESRKYKIEPLERRAAVYSSFQGISNGDYKKMIDALLILDTDIDRQKIMGNYFKESLSALAEGDATKVRENFIRSYTDSINLDPENIRTFFFNRDTHIANQIELLLKSGKKYCIAIGAAHLGSETGVLKKLADKNLIFTQIK